MSWIVKINKLINNRDFQCLFLLFIVVFVYFSPTILWGHAINTDDTFESLPLSKWARAKIVRDATTALWIPNIFSGMPSYGSFVTTPSYQTRSMLFNYWLDRSIETNKDEVERLFGRVEW